MQLGFVSAILHDLSLTEVLEFAATEGFACVELMCWPPGGADPGGSKPGLGVNRSEL